MTEQQTHEIQAWLDGELPAAEAAAMLRLTQTDPAAAQMAQELRRVRSWLAAGEMSRTVPESREFYWSKIQRAIEGRAGAATAADQARVAGWRWLRWLVPAGLAAALAVVLLTSKPPPPQNAGLVPPEIDSPQEDQGTMTFRSDSEQMTVVWLGNP